MSATYSTNIQGLPASALVNAEYTSQLVQNSFNLYSSRIYAAYLALNPTAPQPSGAPTVPAGTDPATYLSDSMQALLALAQNGIPDTSGAVWYLTTEMASVVNVINSSLSVNGINITPTASNISDSVAQNWASNVGSGTGIFAPGPNSVPLIIQTAAQAEATNQTLEGMLAVNYIQNGNTLLSNQLNSLDTQLTQAQSAVGALNQLQDMHNQIQAPNPVTVPTTVLNNTNVFASFATTAFSNSIPPYVVINPKDASGNNWSVPTISSALGSSLINFDINDGNNHAFASPLVNATGSSISSPTTYASVVSQSGSFDTNNLINQQQAIGTAITALENAGVTGQGSLTNALGTVATDISNYVGGNAYTANPTTGALTQSTIVANASVGFVQPVSTSTGGSQLFYGVPVGGVGQDFGSNVGSLLPSFNPPIVASFTSADAANFVSFSSLSSTDQTNMQNMLNNPSKNPVFQGYDPSNFVYVQYQVNNTVNPLTASIIPYNPNLSTQTNPNPVFVFAIAPGFQSNSSYGWIMDGQAAKAGSAESTSGTVQNDLTAAITTGQNLNTQLSQKTQQYLFIFQEFYQSASGMLTAINQFIQQMAQGAGH